MRVGPLLLYPGREDRIAKAATVLMPADPEVAVAADQRGYQAVRTTDFAGLAARLGSQDFGPGIPVMPAHPEKTDPRRYDYQPGFNVSTTPRTYEEIQFPALRNLARSWDVASLCIARNIDDLRQLRWEIRAKAVPNMSRDAVRKRRDALAEVRARAEGFWSTPDQRRSWSSWLRNLALEIYEVDAPVLYLSMSRDDSQLYGVRVIDGTTIAPLVDDRGEPPASPMPAYRQVIRGMPWSYYSADAELPPSQRRLLFDQAHLVYDPFWGRADSPYGHPPMEWIILTVQRALARQVLDLRLYMNGTTSFDFWKMPKEWSADAISALQSAFDKLMQDPTARAHLRFMPGGEGTGLEHGFIAPETAAEEFLLHIACAAYNRSPMEMGFIRSSGGAGLGGKGVGKEQGDAANKSVRAVAFHIKSIVDRITQRHINPELEIVFPELEDTEDAKTRAEAEDIRIKNGSLGVDEARLDNDRDPIGNEESGSTNLFFVGAGAPPVRALSIIGSAPDEANEGGADPGVPSAVPGIAAAPSRPDVPHGKPDVPVPPAPGAQEPLAKADMSEAHLGAWQRKSIKSLRAGRGAAVPFESDAIDPVTARALRAALGVDGITPAHVRALFESIP